MNKLFKYFELDSEKEELQTVIKSIENGVEFRGTNLWILIFAIFVASFGLNVNSAAVIIGAMLISPLMGPIMGIGFGIGINDISLLRKSLANYFIAGGVALATSTFFFFLSPLNEAHSEILARTSPTIYDVLIALFGGFAGIVATSSKQKGNVIPGVAIATALMPPLCTAGYGLATLQWEYFFGAFYLFIINSVFIALATFIIVRLFHFPYKHLLNRKTDIMAQRIAWLVALITLLPSIYFGYDMVRQNRFIKNANHFITEETHLPNDYLLNKKIDAKARKITLVYGGNVIKPEVIKQMQSKMIKYDLDSISLEVKQGFAYLSEFGHDKENEQQKEFTRALVAKDEQINILTEQLDSTKRQDSISTQIFAEIKSQYPEVKNAIVQHAQILGDSSGNHKIALIWLHVSGKISMRDRLKLENWLSVRLNDANIKLIVE